jgi:hypothetical protein
MHLVAAFTFASSTLRTTTKLGREGGGGEGYSDASGRREGRCGSEVMREGGGEEGRREWRRAN